MDQDFIRGRAEHIRDLATKADPFTRKRLLDLADSYERRLFQPSHTADGRLQPWAKREA